MVQAEFCEWKNPICNTFKEIPNENLKHCCNELNDFSSLKEVLTTLSLGYLIGLNYAVVADNFES